MKLPAGLRYTASHEWVRREPDGTFSVGITDHAQEQLGDIVFVEAPQPGRKVAAGEAVGVVESVKAASDIYAPVAGQIVAANAELSTSPEKVNEDAFAAWTNKPVAFVSYGGTAAGARAVEQLRLTDGIEDIAVRRVTVRLIRVRHRPTPSEEENGRGAHRIQVSVQRRRSGVSRRSTR